MTITVWALLAGFLALWLLPALWLTRSSHRAAASGGGALAIAFAAAIVGLASYWYVSPRVERDLKLFTAATALPGFAADCPRLLEARATLEEAGKGVFEIGADGSITVRDDVWQAISPDQRRVVQSLGEALKKCGAGKVETAQVGAPDALPAAAR